MKDRIPLSDMSTADLEICSEALLVAQLLLNKNKKTINNEASLAMARLREALAEEIASPIRHEDSYKSISDSQAHSFARSQRNKPPKPSKVKAPRSSKAKARKQSKVKAPKVAQPVAKKVVGRRGWMPCPDGHEK